MTYAETLEKRVVELESIVTHLQYDLEKFNEVALEQQAEIAELKRDMAKLRQQMSESGESDSVFDPLAERPPHY